MINSMYPPTRFFPAGSHQLTFRGASAQTLSERFLAVSHKVSILKRFFLLMFVHLGYAGKSTVSAGVPHAVAVIHPVDFRDVQNLFPPTTPCLLAYPDSRVRTTWILVFPCNYVPGGCRFRACRGRKCHRSECQAVSIVLSETLHR